MASVDERVVRMVFDNAKFEAGVQKTLATLANLKSALNLDKAGSDFEKLEQASKKVNFSHMSDALDQVSNRFSTFGIVGMTVLQNLTTTAMNTAKSILNSLTAPLIEGGKRRALNIEQAKFQIQGLGYAWEDVSEDINYGVKNTAYGLDSAAKAASQLLASNVKVGDSMKAALRGISGVAAMTSSEYDDIARVFTTVAGNGRLMGDQLNQLSARGLNVAATLGKALGKTEGEIREMVSKGKIDFATFSKAMDDAFGEHAKKANDTFTGSLSNMKAALSRIGAEFATPAYTNLRLAMNALTPAIDDVKASLKPLIETASQAMEAASKLAVDILGNLNLQEKLTGPMEAANKIAIALGKTVVNLGSAIYKIVSPIVRAFDKAFGATLLDIMVRAAEAIADFTSKLVISDRMSNNIQRTFTGVFTVIAAVADILSRVVGLVSGVLWNVISGTFGFFFDITTSITAVIGDLIVGVKDLIDEIRSLRIVKTIGGVIEKVMKTIGLASDEAYKGVQGFADSLFDKTFETSALVLSKIADAIKFVAHALDDAIFKAVEFIAKLRELPVVQRTIQKISEAFDTLRTNVSKVSSNISSKLSPVFDKVKNVIGRLIDKIRELREQYVELPTLQEAVTRLQEFAVDVFEKSIEIFEKVCDIIVKIVDRAKELGEVSFKKVVENLSDLRNNISSTLDMAGKLEFIKDVFFGIRDGIIEMSNTSGSMLNRVKEKLTDFVDWLSGKFSKVTLGDVIAAGAGGSMIVFMLSFSKFLKQAGDLSDAAKGILDKITEIPDAIGKVLKNFAKLEEAKAAQIKMESITGIIKAVALLAGAVAVLATMDQEKVRSSAITIGVLGAALVVITGVMTHLAGSATPDAIAKSSSLMLSLSGALAILVLALKVLTQINMDGIEKRLLVMGVLMAELAAFTIAVSRLSGEMGLGSVAIVAVSISMVMLAKAFQNISSIPMENITAGTALMSAMLILIGLMSRVASTWKKTASAALAIIAIAVALKLIVGTVREFGEMNPEVAEQGIVAVGTMMLALSVLMLTTAASGQYAVRAGAAMILIGAALHLIIEAIKKISSISNSDIDKAQGVVGKILILFGILTLVSKFAGEHSAKAGVAIGLMSGAMILLAGAMAIMAKIDPEGLKRAEDAVTRIMAMFALIVASTSVARKASKTITTMTICISALGGVLAVLSLLEPDNLNAASEALTRLMAMFALLLAATKAAEKVNANIFIMMVVVGELAAILYKLAELPTDKAMSASLALSTVLLSFSATLQIVKNIPVTALEGFGVLLAAVTAFGVFLGAVGALTEEYPKVKDFLEEGIPILKLVGEGIGTIVGSVVNAFVSISSESFAAIGTHLSEFMENAQGFIEGAKGIDESAQSGINTIIGMIMALAAADFIDALTWWSGSGSTIKALTENLPSLGEALKSFADSAGGIGKNQGAMESACNALSLLMKAFPVDIRVGLGAIAFAGIDYDALADGLPKIGTAIKNFATNIAGMDTGSVENTQRSCEIIMALVNSLPQSYGGLVSLFTGGTFIDDFGDRLPVLGHGLFMFAESVAGMDTGSVENTEQACKIIISLARSLPQTYGGLAGVFAGGSFIDDFANQIPMLGHGLFMFAENIAGMDTQSVYNTQQACQMILNLADALPNTYGGLAGMFIGGSFIDEFANQIPLLGHGMFMFAQNIAGMDTQSVYNTQQACRMILALADALPNTYAGLAGIFTGGTFIDDFGNRLPVLGHGFFMYAEKIGGMDTGSVYNTDAASRMIIELCNYISESSGFLGLSRDISMVDLAANLGPLGHGFFMYAENIGGMDTQSVYNTDSAARMIIALCEHISQSSGFLGITRDISMIDLGSNLPILAHGFFMYAQNIAGMDTASVANTMESVKSIIEFVGNLGSVDLSPANSFCDGLKNITDRINNEFLKPLKKMPTEASTAAASIVNQVSAGFEIGLKSANSKVLAGGLNLMGNLKSGMENGKSGVDIAVLGILNGIVTTINWSGNKFSTAGQGIVRNISSGVSKSQSVINTATTTLINNVKTSLLATIPLKFKPVGEGIVKSVVSGVSSNMSLVKTAVKLAVDFAANNISTNSFYKVGKNAMIGMADGIRDNDWRVEAKASAAASKALKAANEALKIHSPSREFYKVGRWTMLGMANGIAENAKYAERSSTEAASDILESTNKILDGIDMTADLNYSPVITPVVDMTNIEQSALYMKRMFDEYPLATGPIGDLANVSSRIETAQYDKILSKLDKLIDINQNESGPRTFEFTQINNSPTALSNSEIYRQTKSQFARFKDKVGK